jgi:signal peptidase I
MSTGIQQRNSVLHYVFRAEVAVGYRELCNQENCAPRLKPALLGLSGRYGTAPTRYSMDIQARDESRCSLAAEGLRSWGVLKVRATGVSMLTTLWPGDVLTVHSVRPEQVEPGEIVLYMRQDRFFIHRIVSKNLTQDEAFLVTRGDSMSENDPPIESSELLGKIIEVHRSGSVFLPARRVSTFRRILAWLFCHWSLFRRVGLRLGPYRWKSDGQVEATLVSAA